MKKVVLFTLFFLTTLTISSQSILGIWKAIDEKTNKDQVLIEVYEKDNKIFGKIIKVLDTEYENYICNRCPHSSLTGKTLKGLVIVKDMQKKKNGWGKGKALDPLTGKFYKCTITFKNKNTLKLRAYIGLQLLGKTDYWYRVIN